MIKLVWLNYTVCPSLRIMQSTPGLGASETVYSIASGIYNGGSILGAILIAVVGKYIPYKVSILIGPVSQVIGFIIYGLSTRGWMVIIARLFMGFKNGANLASVVSYFNYSVPKYNKLALKFGKKQQPNLSTILTLTMAVTSYTTYIPVLGKTLSRLQYPVFPL